MTHNSNSYTRLRGTAFFRITSKARLAKILCTSKSKLLRLSKEKDPYYCFEKEKKNGSKRPISAPNQELKSIQKRIAVLLQRLPTPAYLMAPVKGKSYVSNAAHHIGAANIRLLDIEDYFPSCTQKRVFWFFNTCMECSPDVAGVLAKIATRNGSLPQGSPCSPIQYS